MPRELPALHADRVFHWENADAENLVTDPETDLETTVEVEARGAARIEPARSLSSKTVRVQKSDRPLSGNSPRPMNRVSLPTNRPVARRVAGSDPSVINWTASDYYAGV